MESPESISQGLGAGAGGLNGGSGLADLAMIALVWLIFGVWTSLLEGKRRRRERNLQELDLLGDEFLRYDGRNFRLSPREVERIVISRKSHFWSRGSFRRAQMQFRLRDGREVNFSLFDAQKAHALGAQLSAIGLEIENAD